MGVVSSHQISGLSRADGTTARVVTMAKVAGDSNSFVLRETLAGQPIVALAQQMSHKSYEVRTKSGDITRHSMSEFRWPYELSAAPGVVAGVVTYNRTGLHVPANCPAFVRADIRMQLTQMASNTAGTIGYLVTYAPLINGDFPY